MKKYLHPNCKQHLKNLFSSFLSHSFPFLWKCHFEAIGTFTFNWKRAYFVLAMFNPFSNIGPFLHKGNSFDL